MHISASIITPSTITVVVDGKPRIIDSSRACFKDLPELLNRRKQAGAWTQADEDMLAGYLDMRKYLVRATHGAVAICDDLVMFDGKPIGGVLVDRLIELQKKGYDTEPLSLFLTNLMTNPLQSARDELYLWLEKSNLPITDDGYFLAWKAVRQDYKSHHDGLTDNRIGAKPWQPRDTCDTDRSNTCSRGLHFCSYSYLSHFAHSDSRIMVCKINPADVVSIPNDYSNAKGRAWTYEIVGEVAREDAEEFFKTPVVSAEVGDIEQLDPHGWDGDGDEAMDDTDMGPDVARDEEMLAEDVAGAYAKPEAPKVVAGPAPALYADNYAPKSFDEITNPKALFHAFSWRDSPQGYDFWHAEYMELRDGYPLSSEAKAILRQWAEETTAVVPPPKVSVDIEVTDGAGNPVTVAVVTPQPAINKKTLRSLLCKYSQRRIAKDTGIPRTTLQDMIYRWWPEKDTRPTKKD